MRREGGEKSKGRAEWRGRERKKMGTSAFRPMLPLSFHNQRRAGTLSSRGLSSSGGVRGMCSINTFPSAAFPSSFFNLTRVSLHSAQIKKLTTFEPFALTSKCTALWEQCLADSIFLPGDLPPAM